MLPRERANLSDQETFHSTYHAHHGQQGTKEPRELAPMLIRATTAGSDVRSDGTDAGDYS
jgi:hypothetical protein